MSGQDVGFFDTGEACPDLKIENGDLKADNGLETAALISVFSNKRVTLEQLPQGETDRMGWWADLISEAEGDQIGSRHWVLERLGKINTQSEIEMRSVLKEAFEWMLDDGIASRVEVDAERTDTNEIVGSALIYRPSGDNIPFKFVWDGQKLKLMEQ